MVDVKIDSSELDKAIRRIRGLGEIVTKRQRLAMLRKGAVILRDAARSNVPISKEPYKTRRKQVIQPGFTRDAVDVKSFKRSSDLFVGVVKKGGILAYWAQWLEFGAMNVDGTRRPGMFFMRKALASHGDRVIAAIVAEADKIFQKAIKKLSNDR